MKTKLLYPLVGMAFFAILSFAQGSQPKTVRDFFLLLSSRYFEVGCCGADETTDNQTANRKYLEAFLRVEDTANGYLEGGCDGGQSCITMALFKKQDGNYIVGVHTSNTMSEENYFLEYRSGRWYDVSGKLISQFSKDKVYVLPRHGTKLGVFSTKVIERISSTQVIREQGPKLYDLVWKNGKFTISR